MRKFASVRVLAGLTAWLGIAGTTMPASAAPQTVTGTLVDLYCYAQRKEDTGMHHGNQRECAWACVRYIGMPVGVLTSDGRVYELAGAVVADNSVKIAQHLTKQVRVTGEVAMRDGMPTMTTNDVTVIK